MKNAKRKAIALFALVSLIAAFVSVDFTTSFAGAPDRQPPEKCLHGEDGIFYGVRLHADFLINLMNPICTHWHELWPYYCRHYYHLNSWIDNGDDMLSPSDQIDMIDTDTEMKSWWHVDDVTVTIVVSPVEGPVPTEPPHLEFTGGFQDYSAALLKPECTYWHEVYPYFSRMYHLKAWEDNGDGMISYCDKIYLVPEGTEIGTWYHIKKVATDIIVTRKPICTKWHEIYPEFCEHSYHLSSWIDNNDHVLSPCDKIDLTDLATGAVTWWHVERVTITIVVTEKGIPTPRPMYLELYGKIQIPEFPHFLANPVCTPWHEIWPIFSNEYHLSSWEDNGDGWLSPCDQIDMEQTYPEPGPIKWYHVDKVMIDIWITPIPAPVHDVAVIKVVPHLTSVVQGKTDPIDVTVENQGDFPETFGVTTYYDSISIETKTVTLNPGEIQTLTFYWDASGVDLGTYTVKAYAHPVPGEKDVADNVFVDGRVTVIWPNKVLHCEDGLLFSVRLHADPPELIDLAKPICTYWHELWPYYCKYYHLRSWKDTNGDRMLSPSDQIDVMEMETESISWYHVDDVTVTLALTETTEPAPSMYIEFELGFEGYERVIKEPIGTPWHEIYPVYSRRFKLTSWEDTNGNNVLDPCDLIDLTDLETGKVTWWHVDAVATDLIVTRKPVCTQWHEIYPEYSRLYHLSSWYDNNDHVLSPCDIIDLTDKRTGEVTWWHVVDVTITIVVTEKMVNPVPPPLYLEYIPEIEFGSPNPIPPPPICTWWHEIWPKYCNIYHLTSWEDNGDGWLSPSDQIDMTDEEGNVRWYHVDDIAIDIIIEPCPRVEWIHQFRPIDYFMTFCPSPGVANLDKDLDLEIITGTDEWHGHQRWHCFDSTGAHQWTLPTGCDESRTSVAIGDIDEDGSLEIVGGTTSGWETQVFSDTGSFVWRYSQPNHYDWWHSSPAMCDVNPYRKGLEVVAAEYFSGKVFCFSSTGSVLWTFDTGGMIDASPACADIDYDGVVEVVIGAVHPQGTPHYIYALNGMTGAVEWKHWIQQPSTCCNRAVHSSVAIANIDLDEQIEVVFGANDGGVRCLRGTDGTLKWTYWTHGSVYSSPAIGDVDADGDLEIIVGSNDNYVYCLSAMRGVPTLEWRYLTGGDVVSSPALADRGGIGLAIYIGSRDSKLYVLDGFGNLVWAFDTHATNGITSSPAVADIDGDSKLEVMFTDWNAIPDSLKAGQQNVFWVIEDCTSRCPRYNIEWAMFRHDRCHTGRYTRALFTVTQLGVTYEVDPIERAQSAVDFYDFYSSSGHTPFMEDLVSKIYLYIDATTGELSLIMHHSIDNSTSAQMEEEFDLERVPEGAYTALSDDPRVPPEFNLTQEPEGRWGHTHNSDGGIVSGLPTDTAWCITVNPNFIRDIIAWQYQTPMGVIELDMEDPVTICYNPGGMSSPTSASTVEGSTEMLSPEVHDVAIVFDWLSKTFITAGETVDVYVTVENQGDFIETTNVTVTYDGNFIGGAPVTLKPGENQTLPFPWDTTGVPKGVYSVTADASVVPGETDTVDNTFSTMAVVKEAVHDIAVAYVKPAKTVVGQGLTLKIEITVINQGDFPETFGVTPSYDSKSIGLYQAVTLNPGDITTLTFGWDTKGVAKGTYAIGAYTVTPISGETDLADNTCVDGSVQITIAGDINGDGKVNHKDLLLLASAYGSEVGDPNYIPEADIDCSGKVDHKDLLILASNYGKTDC